MAGVSQGHQHADAWPSVSAASATAPAAKGGAKPHPVVTHELPVAGLRFEYSPRQGPHDTDHVSALAGTLPELPPIVVHAQTMQVIDGVHRVLAARSIGQPTIRAVLFKGSESDARVYAIRNNVVHGKPLTIQERQGAGLQLLREHANWSDRRLAMICGLSAKTIARLRVRATVEYQQSRERIGTDGKTRSTDAAEVRRRIAEAIRTAPDASIRAIAAVTSTSPSTVLDVRRRLDRGADILPPRLGGPEPDGSRDLVESPPSNGAAPSDGHPTSDLAFTSDQERQDFAEWFDSHIISEEDEWQRFVSVVPISRVYAIADTARRCSDSWHRFAAALEQRSKHRR